MALSTLISEKQLTLISIPNNDYALHNSIKSISIVTFPGNLFWVNEGDFVFLSLDLISFDDKLEIFKNLIDKKVTGCCILHNKNKSIIEEEILIMSNQNDLPLLEFAGHEDLLNQINQVFSHSIGNESPIEFIQKQLKNNITCLMNSKDFNYNNLLKLLSLFFNRDCYLLSKQFNLLQYASPELKQLPSDLPFSKWSEEASKWHTDQSYSLEPIIFDYNNQEFYCFALKSEKNVIGYLCIEKTKLQGSELDSYFIAEILPHFILSIINTSKQDLIKRKSLVEYYQNVLYGLFPDETTLKRETSYQHLDYYLNRYIWILQVDSLSKNSVLEEQIPINILSKIKDIAQKTFYHNKFIKENSQIISVHVKDDIPNEKILDKFALMLNDLEIEFPEFSFYIGISRAYDNMFRLKYAYEDATFSLIMGKMLFPDTKKIFTYDDLLIFHFLYQQIHNPILNRLYLNTVVKIKEHDVESQNQLYETLQEIIECDFNFTEVHEKLFIHRNTLYQRIRKIERIIGLSMKSSETRLLLQMGIKMDHIYKVNDWPSLTFQRL